jgi:Icc protein
MRVAWITDPHLDFCHDVPGFLATVRQRRPDVVLLGGDIAESPRLEETLRAIEDALRVPIFFVLGNHDYYRSSTEDVRRRVRALTHESAHLSWLPAVDVVPLSACTGLVGHDGWCDGRHGNYAVSGVRLNDHWLIADLAGKDHAGRLAAMQCLADDGAAHFARVLPLALAAHQRVIVLTHVPPFREAAWHEGKISDRYYLPHFSSKASGDVILREAMARPDREIIVLCGHTHGAGVCRPLPNLHVLTGAALYGDPRVTLEFDVEASAESLIEASRSR